MAAKYLEVFLMLPILMKINEIITVHQQSFL